MNNPREAYNDSIEKFEIEREISEEDKNPGTW
jgi:hypothetical protein